MLKKYLCNLLMVTGLMFIAGCTSYQYLTVNSDLEHNNREQFVSENDSIKIVYSFNGLHGPVTIDFYNKMNIPVYVDWSKSALILDDLRISYWRDEGRLLANGNGVEFRWTPYVASSEMDISGTIYHDEKISFVPPMSNIIVSTINVGYSMRKISSSDHFNRLNLGTRNGFINVKNYKYNSENSPITFRSFITYSMDENFSNPVYNDKKFWVSDIMQTTVPPQQIVYRPSNRFYERKTTPFGKIMGGAAIISILIALSALATTPE